MAVCTMRETYRDRSLSADQECVRVLVRSWDVWVDSLTTTAVEIESTATDTDTGETLPARGTPHPDWPAAECTRLRLRQDTENPYRWFVDAEYSTLADQAGCDPLLEPPEILWDPVVTRVAVDRAWPVPIGGGPARSVESGVFNSATDPFVPAPEKNDGHGRVTITKNLAGFPVAIERDYQFTVNTNAIWGFDPYTVLFLPVAGRWVRKNRVWFFRATFTLEIKRRTWDLFLIDHGFRRLVSGKRVEIHDTRNGLGPGGSHFLNGAGGLLGVGGSPVLLRWRIYDDRALEALGLPNPTQPPPGP